MVWGSRLPGTGLLEPHHPIHPKLLVAVPARIALKRPETITLTLNHGADVTREAKNVTAAAVVIEDWHPHLAVVDVDLAASASCGWSDRARAAGHGFRSSP
jgi:hypothetical protein